MLIKLLAIGLAALLGLGGFTYVNYDEWFKYPALRGYVSSQMKDPASTKFRGERISSSGWLCGEMNAKNGYGAYDGFKRFISASPTSAYVDGIGYVGIEKESSTAEIIDRLKERNQILTDKNAENAKYGNLIKHSTRELEEIVTSTVFNRRWSESCN
jgi:hypothetical protein